jgi:hypothetical protein
MTAAGFFGRLEMTMADEVSNTESQTPASEIALFKSGGQSTATGASIPDKAATPAAQERDEGGKFKAKESEKVEAKPEAETAKPVETASKPEAKAEKPTGQLAALMAERSKRQALEQELAALKQGKQTESPDIFTEPEKAVKALVDKEVAPLKIRFFQRSVADAQKAYPDFGDAYENFAKIIDAGNAALLAELQAADDPGEFIYLVGSNTPEFRAARDTKHREEMTAKDAEITALKAEIETLKGARKAQDEVPESLNRQPSGAVPARDSDRMDINNIVRFKSG